MADFVVHTQVMARTCSIARALALVGERWALLVVREVSLGVRRFAEIQVATGAPPAVLSARLRDLVAAGVLETRPYQEPGSRAREEYVLTPVGRSLQPVLTALKDWGDAHLCDERGIPVVTRHVDCGAPVHAELVCESGHRVGARELRAEPRWP
ncbi:MAG: transcriptional regulator, HxlR family [Frankiales bacterium]|nr:transcriptional regulator, HxlR family [Frankiales bacterium]